MKNLYTSTLLILLSLTSFAQEKTFVSNNAIIEKNQIIEIKENQIVSLDEVSKDSKSEDEFRYYYLPNMYAYFDLKTNNYIYKVNNKWQKSSKLPEYYGGYSLFKNTRIPLMNFLGDNPQEKLNEHKKEFPYIKKSRMLKSLNFDGNTAISSVN